MSAMDITEDTNTSIVLDIQSSSGLSISVHPLVLLNISDHYTRTKLQNPSVVENVKQVFPQLDFMGWYSLGSTPNETDLKLHEQASNSTNRKHRKFLQINESALFLQLDPSSLVTDSGIRDFPVSIYESIFDIANERTRLAFIKAAYRVETGEAECIAVDHVAKPSTSSADTGLGNTLIAHLTTQRNAIAMLHTRIQFLLRYLQDTESSQIPMDHDIVRQISSLCRRSPILEKKAFETQFSTEYDDVLLVAYLATITKGLNTVNDLVDKLNLVNGGHSSTSSKTMSMNKKGRRMHGRH
ncbi:COP9 signalosome complex subunit 6 [Choanephora cucurbitarum]|uniref:COP9 signalosome complex subunit 6 n=1 Tax=Choanephora cucurbitarum TaxID=101091 RepID=A0A1C7NRA2_9FUNG|nr:COP9 signalosome complex subunit 6 [Choanephora cucurbitarum]